ncbi:Uncharacterized protein OBRU01_09384 [Operophtera brumata]|uniref:Uncharacterized protein n=1 Tax=Operophtera brumata TaxID=104452 RepID=A0A0L7LFR8_OPEBR|nr:Uncharacterized protein OBRU01_09384 [Operophtera brumata]
MCSDADKLVPSMSYGLPLTPQADSCRTARHALTLIATARAVPVSTHGLVHQGAVTACAFSPDGRYLVSYATSVNRLSFWQSSAGEYTRASPPGRGHPVRVQPRRTGAIIACAFSPDGRYLVPYATSDNRLSFWQSSAGMFGLGAAQTRCVKCYSTAPMADVSRLNPARLARLVWTNCRTVTLMLADGSETRVDQLPHRHSDAGRRLRDPVQRVERLTTPHYDVSRLNPARLTRPPSVDQLPHRHSDAGRRLRDPVQRVERLTTPHYDVSRLNPARLARLVWTNCRTVTLMLADGSETRATNYTTLRRVSSEPGETRPPSVDQLSHRHSDAGRRLRDPVQRLERLTTPHNDVSRLNPARLARLVWTNCRTVTLMLADGSETRASNYTTQRRVSSEPGETRPPSVDELHHTTAAVSRLDPARLARLVWTNCRTVTLMLADGSETRFNV